MRAAQLTICSNVGYPVSSQSIKSLSVFNKNIFSSYVKSLLNIKLQLSQIITPFSKVALFNGYYEAILGEYIPVQAGETLYGELWAKRNTGATGTAGLLYAGVAQYDKDKNVISANVGLSYFVASAITVPTNSTWTKYSGTITLQTSHTPYSGSDGGPVRYIRPYIIVNNASGTIPTYIGAYIIRKIGRAHV